MPDFERDFADAVDAFHAVTVEYPDFPDNAVELLAILSGKQSGDDHCCQEASHQSSLL
jgi:hypothetical protein